MGIQCGASTTGSAPWRIVLDFRESRNLSSVAVIRLDVCKGLEWDAGTAVCQSEPELGCSKVGWTGQAMRGAGASYSGGAFPRESEVPFFSRQPHGGFL